MFISRYRSFRPLGVFFLTLKLQTVFILLIDVWSHSGDREGSILDFRQRDLCGIPTGKHWYHLLIWRHQYQFLYVPYRIWRKYIWSQYLYGIGLSGFKTRLVQYFLPNFWLTTTTTAYIVEHSLVCVEGRGRISQDIKMGTCVFQCEVQ